MSVDPDATALEKEYAEFQQCGLRGIALFRLGLLQSS